MSALVEHLTRLVEPAELETFLRLFGGRHIYLPLAKPAGRSWPFVMNASRPSTPVVLLPGSSPAVTGSAAGRCFASSARLRENATRPVRKRPRDGLMLR